MITDNQDSHELKSKKVLHLCNLYVGDLREESPNKWLYNTYQNEKLPSIIDKFISKSRGEQAAKEESNKANSLEIDGSLSSYQVLIVDDHPINRVMLSDQISNIGFSTCTAVDGIDALKYLENHTVDIVLTDVNMPNMDGYGLSKALRNLGSTVPIIALTANAMEEEKQRCRDAGMNGCLSKPTKITTLKETLLKFVGNK
nr:response regulator [Providencia stuartii]